MSDPVSDPRDDLAWDRSALAFAGIGLTLFARAGRIGPARRGTGLAVLAIGVCIVLVGLLYRRRRRRSAEDVGPLLAELAAATAALGAITFVLGLLS